jgi:hypothetical protein
MPSRAVPRGATSRGTCGRQKMATKSYPSSVLPGMSEGSDEHVERAFTWEHVRGLTGLSKRQLQNWGREEVAVGGAARSQPNTSARQSGCSRR